MPGRKPWGGFVHDGCVIADDTGGSIDGHQLDLFMGAKRFYRSFDRRHRLKSVQVYPGESWCNRERDTSDVEVDDGIAVHRNST